MVGHDWKWWEYGLLCLVFLGTLYGLSMLFTGEITGRKLTTPEYILIGGGILIFVAFLWFQFGRVVLQKPFKRRGIQECMLRIIELYSKNGISIPGGLDSETRHLTKLPNYDIASYVTTSYFALRFTQNDTPFLKNKVVLYDDQIDQIIGETAGERFGYDIVTALQGIVTWAVMTERGELPQMTAAPMLIKEKQIQGPPKEKEIENEGALAEVKKGLGAS